MTSVSVYNKLSYNAFGVFPPSNTGIDERLVAHSPPNLIARGIPERLKNGTAFITSLYHGSPVESFDLKGFYFGCIPDVVIGEVTLVGDCVVTVTVCSAKIIYNYIFAAMRLCTVPVYFRVPPTLSSFMYFF